MQSMHAFVCTKGYFVQKWKVVFLKFSTKNSFAKWSFYVIFALAKSWFFQIDGADGIFWNAAGFNFADTLLQFSPRSVWKCRKYCNSFLPQKSQMKCISKLFPCSFLKKVALFYLLHIYLLFVRAKKSCFPFLSTLQFFICQHFLRVSFRIFATHWSSPFEKIKDIWWLA